MKRVLPWIIAALMLCVGAPYCWQTLRGEIHPVFATWAIMAIANTLSWSTFWSSKDRNWSANVMNLSGMLASWVILLSVIVSGHGTRFWFNTFELWCLGFVVVILIFWWQSRQHVTSNLLVQVLMSVCYLPTLYHLWTASTNTEPIGVWTISAIASGLSVILAGLKRNRLSVVYASRSLFFSLAIILLILRLEML